MCIFPGDINKKKSRKRRGRSNLNVRAPEVNK